MAVANIVDSNILLVFETGVDQEGNPVYKRKTYANVNTASTPDQIQQVAQSIAVLSKWPLFSIQRVDKHEITE